MTHLGFEVRVEIELEMPRRLEDGSGGMLRARRGCRWTVRRRAGSPWRSASGSTSVLVGSSTLRPLALDVSQRRFFDSSRLRSADALGAVADPGLLNGQGAA